MITLSLTDDTTTLTLQLPEPPLVFEDSNKDVQNTTIDNKLKIYIYPGADKTIVKQTFAYMKIADYNALRGFRTRQRSTGNFPKLSITGLSTDITNMPVYLDMGGKNVIDNCETVQDLSVTFRES